MKIKGRNVTVPFINVIRANGFENIIFNKNGPSHSWNFLCDLSKGLDYKVPASFWPDNRLDGRCPLNEKIDDCSKAGQR